MGLIKAIAGSIGGTLSDQWLDLIKCDNMDMDTLMVKQTTKSGQISKNSRVIVAPGQVAVIYDSGVVLDATAEEGIYTFDKSSSLASSARFLKKCGNVSPMVVLLPKNRPYSISMPRKSLTTSSAPLRPSPSKTGRTLSRTK